MSDFSDDALQSYPFADITLPKNWERVSLGEISANISPGFASGKHNSDGSGVPHLRPMNVDRDGQIDLSVVKSVAESKDVELKSGDILFNNTNSAELVGKTAVVSHRETGFAFSNHMTRLQLESGIASSFVARQLHFLWMSGYMKYRCTNHVNQASISSKTLANTIPFFLPPSAEQIRIVAKLEELLTDLDAGVAELKTAQKKLKQYRQSLLKSAVEGMLTAEWRAQHKPTETGAQLLQRILTERRASWEAKQLAKFKDQGKAPPKDWQKKYPEPAQANTSDLPELPAGWVWASVEQISEIQGGIQKQPSRAPKVNKYPFLRVANVARGKLKLDDIHEIELFPGELERLALVAGDVLIVEGNGSLTEIGRCALWDGSVTNAVHQNHLIRVRPIGVVSQFLETWLNSFGGIDKLTKLAATTSGLYTLSVGKISKVPVPIAPRTEQEAAMKVLVESLLALDFQEQSVSLSLKQSTAQRQNILRAAFAGQLVSQDPNDEPARILLERIRAERDKQTKVRKVRKTKQQKEVAAVVSKLIDVLAEAGDWVSAQEAFRRCGVADGALTDQIEALYAELRALDKSGRLAVEAVIDEHGRKLHDRLKLMAG
ncbi:restriction endonuclease subunit S [Pseudomonas syringae]|uniref:restriction endonuclease subunit S n=1 Tax=Pseudomonas syringae TaxID=317 RepID=UPI000EFFA6D0|nr:restriction endonuclease subunit S [Pseudomonas syringae]MDP5164113.1 restriction endonuclease subunit S [Pseudomonas syringae pv. aptata str. DSM 50252]RMO46204.1 Restriction modification system DNA specificity domain [Pseudomonas syringae]